MNEFVVYKTINGVITKLLTIDEADIGLNIESGEDYIFHPIAEIDFDIHYVFGGEVEVMPNLNTVASWDKTDIIPDSVDTANLSGLPNPSNVVIDSEIDGVIYLSDEDVTDGIASVTTSVNGVFKVVASAEGYQDYIEFINSGQIIGISILNLFTDFDSSNIAEDILVDTLNVIINTPDNVVSDPQLITMDVMSMVLDINNDVIIRIEDTVDMDILRINTLNRHPNMNNNTTGHVDLLSVGISLLDISLPVKNTIMIDVLSITSNIKNAFPQEITL